VGKHDRLPRRLFHHRRPRGERDSHALAWLGLLSVFTCDEAAPAGGGDDQAFVSQGGQDLAGSGLGDAVLLVPRGPLISARPRGSRPRRATTSPWDARWPTCRTHWQSPIPRPRQRPPATSPVTFAASHCWTGPRPSCLRKRRCRYRIRSQRPRSGMIPRCGRGHSRQQRLIAAAASGRTRSPDLDGHRRVRHRSDVRAERQLGRVKRMGHLLRLVTGGARAGASRLAKDGASGNRADTGSRGSNRSLARCSRSAALGRGNRGQATGTPPGPVADCGR
jgi:hypothetical protein